MLQNERCLTLLASALMALVAAAAYPVERVLMPDVPSWAKLALAAVVFLIAFALLLPVWLPVLVPQRFRKLRVLARTVSALVLLLIGLGAITYALLVAGLRLHLALLAVVGLFAGGWQLLAVARHRARQR